MLIRLKIANYEKDFNKTCLGFKTKIFLFEINFMFLTSLLHSILPVFLPKSYKILVFIGNTDHRLRR